MVNAGGAPARPPAGAPDPHGRGLAILAVAVPSALLAAVAAGLADPRPLLVLVALGGLACVVAQPRLALFATVLVIWLNLSDVAIRDHGLPSIDKLLIPAALAAVLLRWWRSAEAPALAPRLPVLLAAFFAAATLSLLVAEDTGVVVATLTDLAKNMIVALTIVLLAHDRRGLLGILRALTLAGLVLGATSAAQWLLAMPALTFGGLARVAMHQITVGHDAMRSVGPLDDPNAFAQILVPLVPIAWSRACDEETIWLRLMAALALIALATAIVGTYSRSAFAVILLLVPLAALRWHGGRPLLLGASAAALVAAAALFLPQDYLRRNAAAVAAVTTPDAFGGARGELSVSGRADEMHAALTMAVDHPLLGVGIGHYRLNFQRYLHQLGLAPRHEDRQAHSLYLEILAERGAVGLIALAMLLGAVARSSLASRRRVALDRDRTRARAVEALLMALGAYFLFGVVLHRNYEQYAWVLIGAVLAASQAGLSPAPEPQRRSRS